MTKNILVLGLLLMVMVGCNNTSIVEEEVIDLPVPEHGYILFNTGVDSRGELIEGKLTDDFVVHGYRYTNTWEAAKVLATPNEFYGELIEYDEGKNVHFYSPMKPWLGTQKYSFFAYYPDATNIATISNTYEGNPYIEYTLASRTDPTSLKDVMTAHVIDTDASARTVDFTMKHRLSAIDVVGRNFNDEGKYVEVSELVIHFTNLFHNKVTIPLNYKDEPNLKHVKGDTLTGNAANADYTLISNSSNKIIVNSGGTETLLSQGKTMIVIPQKVYLEGTIDLTFKNQGGTEVSESKPLKMNCEILSGRRYYVQLTFTQENVTIAIIQSEEWKDTERIDHEFE